MKFLPCSWRTTDMIMRTFYNQHGVINRVIYELPQHDAVNKYSKMSLFEKNGNWFVVARSRQSQNAKSHVPCENTRTELYTYEKCTVQAPEIEPPAAMPPAAAPE